MTAHNLRLHENIQWLPEVSRPSLDTAATSCLMYQSMITYESDAGDTVLQLKIQKENAFFYRRKIFSAYICLDTTDKENRSPIKRIGIKPNSYVFLQKPRHQAGDWTTFKDAGELIRGTVYFISSKSKLKHASLEKSHHIKNTGLSELKVIEIPPNNFRQNPVR